MSLVDQLKAQGLKSEEERNAHLADIKERLKKSSPNYKVGEVNEALNETTAELTTAISLTQGGI